MGSVWGDLEAINCPSSVLGGKGSSSAINSSGGGSRNDSCGCVLRDGCRVRSCRTGGPLLGRWPSTASILWAVPWVPVACVEKCTLPCSHIQWLMKVLMICAQGRVILEHLGYKHSHTMQDLRKIKLWVWLIWAADFSAAAPSVLQWLSIKWCSKTRGKSRPKEGSQMLLGLYTDDTYINKEKVKPFMPHFSGFLCM